MALFTNDIHILIIDKNTAAVQARLNRVIKQCETWFSNNSLIVNTDKTKAILFHLNKTCNVVTPKIQGGSNMTGTDLCVNKPHCAAAVRS